MSFPIMWSGPQSELAPSVIEARQPAAAEIKEHMVEWFSGQALDTIWTVDNQIGTGSVAMVQTINGGLRITSGGTAGDHTVINFGGTNSINHYESTGSAFISIFKSIETSAARSTAGLHDDGAFDDRYAWEKRDLNDNFLLSAENCTTTFVESSIPKDVEWHLFKAVISPT